MQTLFCWQSKTIWLILVLIKCSANGNVKCPIETHKVCVSSLTDRLIFYRWRGMETGCRETRLKSSGDPLPWQQDYQSVWRCSDPQCKSTFDKRGYTVWRATWLWAASDSWLAVNKAHRTNLVENAWSVHRLARTVTVNSQVVFIKAVQHYTVVIR